MSVRLPMVRAMRRGAYSVMYSATPRAIGTAITKAIVLDISVPAASARMPNLWVPSGLHSFVVQKLASSLPNAGNARQIRKMAIAASTQSSAMPAPRARPANAASARLVLRNGFNACLGCGGSGGRQRCEAERGRLALTGGDREVEVTLQQVQATEAGRVLAAHDRVTDRRDRVGVCCRRLVVERLSQVRRGPGGFRGRKGRTH